MIKQLISSIIMVAVMATSSYGASTPVFENMSCASGYAVVKAKNGRFLCAPALRSDAPSNGSLYARLNSVWTSVAEWFTSTLLKSSLSGNENNKVPSVSAVNTALTNYSTHAWDGISHKQPLESARVPIESKGLTLTQAAVASTLVGKTVVISGAQTVSASLSWPSDRSLEIAHSGLITVNTGQVLTINGPFYAKTYKCFNCVGTGKILFGTGAVTEIVPQWWGAIGDGVTNNYEALQRSIDSAIQSSTPMYVPSGTYIIGYPRAGDPNYTVNSPIYLSNLTADHQGLTMRGAGRGATIFKEMAGETARINSRYTKMFYCNLAAHTYLYGSFTFSDITFDKNAQSNTFPATPYAWESTHIIAFQGAAGTPSIDAVTFERIALKNKTACGIVLGPSNVRARSVVMRDIQSTDHINGIDHAWGHKGCIETAIDSDNTVYENINAIYAQIELTEAPSVTRPTYHKVSNSKIDIFEFTGPSSTEAYTYVDISGLVAKTSFLIRGLRVTVTNSRVKFIAEHFNLYQKMVNCTILLPYNESTYVVSPCIIGYASWTVPPVADFVNCGFMIDSATVNAGCTGYALKSVKQVAASTALITLSGCTFDPRLYGVVDAYSYGGRWVFNNCVLAGHTVALLGGATVNKHSSITVNNCDFSQVTGEYLEIKHYDGYDYRVVINGVYEPFNWKQFYLTSNANQNNYIGKPRFVGSTAPVNNYWFIGDRVYSAAPTAGGSEGWVCTAAGYGVKAGWVTGTAYTTTEIVSNASKLYKAMTTGTSGGTAPTHTSGTVSDGGVDWHYIGASSLSSTWKTFGIIGPDARQAEHD